MARTVIRFDDLCPTINWDLWDRIETLLDRCQVQPLVAVVPDNRDPELMGHPANQGFWERVRAWQRKGWVIGQHGYQHLYDSNARSIVPWWRQSEFAGHSHQVQSDKITRGRSILEAQGVTPEVWIAPSHSFDRTTLRVLSETGLVNISDGVGFRVQRDAMGFTWVPAQPWPVPVPADRVETIIWHPNLLKDCRPVEAILSDARRELMGPRFRWKDLIGSATARGATDAVFERVYWGAYRCRRLVARTVRACVKS